MLGSPDPPSRTANPRGRERCVTDAGAEQWATIASLVETAKLNDVEPLAYLSDILTKIVNGHSNSQIDDLLPWAYAANPELKAVA